MKLPTTKFDTNLRSPISALGAPHLPSQVVRRPGFLETIFASRPEREMHREREAGALAVEREQVNAAVEVAIVQTRNVAEIKLKSLTAETSLIHHELETQMQNNEHDAERVQAATVNSIARETFAAEKAALDAVKAAEAAGELAPERAQILAEIMRGNTERVVQSALDMQNNIGQARRGRNLRALSIKE